MNTTTLYYFIDLQELFKTVLDDRDYQEKEKTGTWCNGLHTNAHFYLVLLKRNRYWHEG